MDFTAKSPLGCERRFFRNQPKYQPQEKTDYLADTRTHARINVVSLSLSVCVRALSLFQMYYKFEEKKTEAIAIQIMINF